jgi:hypothetical protein
LLLALLRPALIGFLQEEEVASLVSLPVEHNRDTATTLIKGDDTDSL